MNPTGANLADSTGDRLLATHRAGIIKALLTISPPSRDIVAFSPVKLHLPGSAAPPSGLADPSEKKESILTQHPCEQFSNFSNCLTTQIRYNALTVSAPAPTAVRDR